MLTTLGTPIDAGVVGAAIVLPAVFGALAGGVVIDRIGPRRTSVAADVLSGAAVVAIPIAAATIGLGLPLVVGLAFAGALLDSPGQTARQVILPDLAVRAGVRLEKANASFQTIENAALLIGPAVAGLIIVALGPLGALWIDGATFVVSATAIRVLIPDIRPTPGDGPADLGAGLRAVARDPVLRMLTVAAAGANLVGTPIFVVVLPSLAAESGDSAAVLGAMVAAFGAGLVAGSVAYGVLGGRIRRRLVLVAAFSGNGVALLAASAAPSLPILLASLALAGLAAGPINPLAFTIMQERVPAATRGRVFGAVLGGVLVAAPVGMLGIGALADARGARSALFVSGLTFVAIAAALAILRASRDLERSPDGA